MKTKNILKIGIFSLILFTLLISPILKINSFQVRANGEVLKTTQEIKSSLVDKNALTICQVDTDKWILECKKNHNDLLCEAQGSFILSWCEIVKGTLEGLGKMFAGLINLEIEWILKALNPDIYGGIAANVGMQAVWKLMRDITNALLILGFIWIAIATILGYKKYAWKQILWKLIIVALLVNFSLVITGIIVDASNYLTAYFLNMSQENNESIAPRIMKGYGYTKITNTTTDQYDPPYIFGEDKYKTTQIVQDEDAKKEVDKYTLGFGNFFIITFIMILVGGFAVIALLTIFLTIVVRNFFLILLLGLSPIVFATWIFPDTEKYWKMWWSNFLKWCFFPVVFALSLYLALTVMNNMPPIGTESPMAVTIIRMVLFSMFLVGGLIFSLQGGGAISQSIMKQASKTGKIAGGFLGHKTLKGVTGSETWRKAQKKLEGSKFAPTHDIGVWMSRQPGKIRADELKQIEEDYKGKSPDRISTDMEAHKADKGRVTLGLNTLIEKGSLDYKRDNKSIEIAKNQPNLNVSGIKKINPELYAEYFTKPEDMNTAIEQMKQNIPGISSGEAKNRVIINLTAEQLLKSSPDDIKSGNWENILDRLEEKGTQYTNQFFHTLLDKNLPAENLAAMLRSTNNTEKRIEYIERFIGSVEEKIHGTQVDAIDHLKTKGYYKNKFLKEHLPD